MMCEVIRAVRATWTASITKSLCSHASIKSRGGYMNDRSIIAAAMIVGGAVVAASFYGHSRFALSAADSNVAWRMDTWSGQVDLCAAVPTPNGPLVRCGAIAAVRPPVPVDPPGAGADAPDRGAPPSRLESSGAQSL
jgi:hypothetical protein